MCYATFASLARLPFTLNTFHSTDILDFDK